MNDLKIRPGERVLHEELGIVWLRSWFRSRAGRLVLTSERLLFESPKNMSIARGPISRELENRVPVDIPRDGLVRVERGMHRRGELLIVHTEHEAHRFLARQSTSHWHGVLRQTIRDDQAALQAVVEALAPRTEPPPYR